jgi:23S rRNA pseudouridine2605 synthase
MEERMQKIISSAGITSRRKAEEMIRKGMVTVNGRIVTELGSKADISRDKVRIGTQILRPSAKRVTVLLHKPVGYVSTVRDPEGRPTVMNLVKSLKERLYPVGRLDYNSSGLLLLTNDGDLANFLMSRKSAIPRTYTVKVSGSPKPEDITRLQEGVVLDGRRTAPARIRPIASRPDSEKTWFEITLVEGRYHQVRRMFERIGCPVVKLKRTQVAFLNLHGVSPGKFRLLTLAEVDRLHNWKSAGTEL